MTFKRSFVILCLSAAILHFCGAQTWETTRLVTPQQEIEPGIAFLQHPPIIDGVLDKELESLAIRRFLFVSRYSSDSLTRTHYRLAYGTGFFYFYVEAKAGSLVFRDRAYQNGDGFVMVLAKALADGGASDEFYEGEGTVLSRSQVSYDCVSGVTRREFAFVAPRE